MEYQVLTNEMDVTDRSASVQASAMCQFPEASDDQCDTLYCHNNFVLLFDKLGCIFRKGKVKQSVDWKYNCIATV